MAFDRTTDFPQIKYLFFVLNNPDRTISLNTARGWLKRQSADRNPLQVLRKQIPELGDLYKDDESLLSYLSENSNRKTVFNKLTLSNEQRTELGKILQFGETAEQSELAQVKPGTSQIVSPEQAGTMQGPTETGGSPSAVPMGGFPSVPSFTSPAGRVVYRSPKTPAPPKPEPGAKIVTANKSGFVTEPSSPSKLVSASGGSIGEKYTPPSKIYVSNISDKGRIVTREQPLRYSSGFGNSMKSGLSSFGRSANKLAGGVLKNGVGMLNTGNIPGKGAVGRFRGAASNAGSSLKSAGKKRWLLMLSGLLFSGALIGGLVTSSNPTNQPISTAPLTGNYGLDYTLPIKDPTIVPLDIKDQVKAAFPGAKLEYWENIIKRSVENSLNPALVLALWIEETGASQTTIKANGGSEMPTSSGGVSLGHLGCAPWENQTIDESLTCLFKFGASYSNDQFAQFMAAYSGGPASDPFSNNPNFTGNIKTWYSNLVPVGAGAITPIAPTAINGTAGFVYYCQGNTTWQTVCSLGNSGCGPTSLAMILTTFGAICNGKTCDPVEVDKIIRENGWRSCGGASSTPAILQSDWLKNLGFEVGPNILNGTILDITQAKKYIDNGYLILGSSRSYPCANCRINGSLVDHIFVIDSIDVSLNSVDIRDANNCSYADGNDENQSNRVKKVDAFTWLYAYPIKKVR